MAEFNWIARSPIETESVSARLGRQDGPAGVTVREIREFDLALVACRHGKWAELIKNAKSRFGVEPPALPEAVQGGQALFVWSGPEQFLVLAPRKAAPLAGELAETLGEAASVSDQSDARCLLKLSGPHVRDMLAKLVAVDLDDTCFPAGAAAVTVLDHTNVCLWRDPGGAADYRVLCLTSYAGSIWHAIMQAGAEFGVNAGTASFEA